MKATSIAKLFSVLVGQQIKFSVEEMHGKTYQEAFQVLSHDLNPCNIVADGVYLRVWAQKKSLVDDIVSESISSFIPEVTLEKIVFEPLFQDRDICEWEYIIKIEDK